MIYLSNIVIGSTNAPAINKKYTNKIGVAGKYFIKGLINDPMNSYFFYLFTIDKSVASGNFGVFKIDFTRSFFKYVYTTLSMSSGLSFKAQSFSDDITNRNLIIRS